jgi:hypothetical protein
MLLERVWGSVAKGRELLCIACFEKRLGRELTLDDLHPCPATEPIFLFVERAVAAAKATRDNANAMLKQLLEQGCAATACGLRSDEMRKRTMDSLEERKPDGEI